uniref:Uncharacterized protein n=1 Tax=Anopheles farauti TaxID=69004 RepID=A0A182Q916_9DIPT
MEIDPIKTQGGRRTQNGAIFTPGHFSTILPLEGGHRSRDTTNHQNCQSSQHHPKKVHEFDSPLPRREPTHIARRSRLEMMEQRPHRCITPSTDPWRELDDCRLAEEGSTAVAPPAESVAAAAVVLVVVVVVVVVVLMVAVVVLLPPPALSVGARRPSDAEVPRDLFDAATLTAFAGPYGIERVGPCANQAVTD